MKHQWGEHIYHFHSQTSHWQIVCHWSRQPWSLHRLIRAHLVWIYMQHQMVSCSFKHMSRCSHVVLMKLCKLNIKVCKRCGWITQFAVKKIQPSVGHIKICFRGTCFLLIIWGLGWTTRKRCLGFLCNNETFVCTKAHKSVLASLNLYVSLFPEELPNQTN